MYSVQERAGERDLHFSAKGCARATETPGASQGYCSNEDCGVVAWHLHRKRFDDKDGNGYKEQWDDDLSVVVFRDGSQKLVWRDLNLVVTSWKKIDLSQDYCMPEMNAVQLTMLKQVVEAEKIPATEFRDPSFVPPLAPWREQQPLV